MRPSSVTVASDELLAALLRSVAVIVIEVVDMVVVDMVGHRTISTNLSHLTRSKEAMPHHVFAPSNSMSRLAKATLILSVVLSSFTVWGVHYLQQQEHDVCISVPSGHSVDFDQFSLRRQCTRVFFGMTRGGNAR